MLIHLRMQDFALIPLLEVEFGEGLNVMTGETGAGKSIIIDAVNLVLGGRASQEFIRYGAEKALIDATFTVPSHQEFYDLLKEWGILGGEDDEYILLSREISINGKNICRINGRPATLTMLRQVGEYLLDLHGQHDHQSLLQTEIHGVLLDNFGGRELVALKEEVSSLFSQIKGKERELRELGGNELERNRRKDLLSFQLQEIDSAKLSPTEEEELLQERKILANAEKLYAAAKQGHVALYEGDEQTASSVDMLGKTINMLEPVATVDPRLAKILENLRSASYLLEDASLELRSYVEGIEFDPNRLEDVENRLFLLSRLKKRYGENIPAILDYRDQIAQELYNLENADALIEVVKKEQEKLQKQYLEKALALSEKRKEVALVLHEKVINELKDLGMEKTSFQVAIRHEDDDNGLELEGRRVHASATGIDHVEFLIAPNPGEPLRPLAKIASGGEMSRIMLALKTILAEVDRIPTLVFDEVDTGIGGRTAQAVGKKLSYISEQRQVICVTHSPQIAAMADIHLSIRKEFIKNNTVINVEQLSTEGRVNEIARMLGGAAVTDTTFRHAEEMLNLAHNYKIS